MNSPLGYDLAKARVADLHRAAMRPTVARTAAQPRPVRQRAGWWLVGVGLRIATGPATAR
ncbi:MAG TPA: hypothetical protein VHB18_12980 [Mycobacteriales bacterium]|jgi:hypothetical protein|nr:hypothetical protein [Mycobacteriales bacterium]